MKQANLNHPHNFKWPIPVEKLRNIEINERFICMFSGGKDSGLALSIACKKGVPMSLIHCIDNNNENSMFHAQSINIVERQAEAMNIPLNITYNSGWQNQTQLVRMYRKFAEQGVQSIVFGDIYLNENAKRQATLCACAGLVPRMPLWKLSKETLLAKMEEHKLLSVITLLTTKLIDKQWLGKIYNRDSYLYFQSLGLDPLGENGEFHTTLVNGDIFYKPLKYKLMQIENMFEGYRIIIDVNNET